MTSPTTSSRSSRGASCCSPCWDQGSRSGCARREGERRGDRAPAHHRFVHLSNHRRELMSNHRLARLLFVAVVTAGVAVAIGACGSTKKSSSTENNNQATSGGSANPNAPIKKGLS